jgi:hypothetical protein
MQLDKVLPAFFLRTVLILNRNWALTTCEISWCACANLNDRNVALKFVHPTFQIPAQMHDHFLELACLGYPQGGHRIA